MNTILALFTFGLLLTGASQVARVRLLRRVRDAGWTVEPSQTTATSIGPWIAKSVGDFRVRVSLPVVSAENWGKGGAPWKPRWHLRVEGAFAAIPTDGVVVTRRGSAPTMVHPPRLKQVRCVLDDVAVVRGLDDATIEKVLADEDVNATLRNSFRHEAPFVEIVLLPSSIEARTRRRSYDVNELESVCKSAVEMAESFEAA